jgi:hypothetical protein
LTSPRARRYYSGQKKRWFKYFLYIMFSQPGR